MAKFDSYVICTSPRSGSTLLCSLLAATGVAGNPESYFHEPALADWLDRFNLTPDPDKPERNVLADIFRAAIAKGSLGTGVFGLRLQRHSFEFFMEKLSLLYPGRQDDRDRFAAAFGETLFVHLTRADKVDQAVSYVMANRTGLWHRAPDGTELERLAAPRTPVYDEAEIRRHYTELMTLDTAWEDWFSNQDIAPLRLTYDALSADPIETLCQVLDRLGLDRKAAQDVSPGVAKLADSTNRDWVARFRARHERG